MSNREIQAVDSGIYNRDYFEGTDGAAYFQASQTAPKFLKAVRMSNLREGSRVLDLGCGRGDLTLALAAGGARVVAIDYSLDAIEIAKKTVAQQAPELQKKIKIINSDATRLGGQQFEHRINDAFYITILYQLKR